MPKDVYVLRGFHGGINQGADAKDIQDSDVVHADNIDIAIPGQVGMGRAEQDNEEGVSIMGSNNLDNVGSGLHTFRSDYDMLKGNDSRKVSGDSFNTQGTDYIVTASTNKVDIYDCRNNYLDDDALALGSDVSGCELAMHSADGALHVVDSNFDNANPGRWLGFIDKKFFINDVDADGVVQKKGWVDADSKIMWPYSSGFQVQIDNHPALGDTNQDPDSYISNAPGYDVTFIASGFNSPNGNICNPAPYLGGTTERIYFYATYIYDGKQESLPVPGLTAWEAKGGTEYNALLYYHAIKYNNHDNSTNIDDAATPNPGISQRVTGGRIYYRHASVGGNLPEEWSSLGTLWELSEWNIEKGTRLSGSDVWAPWYKLVDTDGTYQDHYVFDYVGNQGDGSVFKFGEANMNVVLDLPKVATYEMNNQHGPRESVEARAKTYVVMNKRVYAGNVETHSSTPPELNGAKNYYPDRILKSPVGQYDKFPEENFLDVVVDDGDSIIKLAAFADRILQFKKKALYIINTAQEYEFLEQQYNNMGVPNKACVVTIPQGVVWINSIGCYMYNGEQIVTLTERKGLKLISDTNWDISDSAQIGYSPKSREIVVISDASDVSNSNIFIFNMLIQGWVKANGIFSGSEISNFITDNFDKMAWLVDNNNAYKSLKLGNNDSPATAKTILETKTVDMGNPSIRKKMYNVKLTYKSNGASNVTVSASPDNGSTYQELDANLATTSGNWSTIDLSLPSAHFSNVYHIRIKFACNGTAVPNSFGINDVTVIFRLKKVK